MLQLQPELPDLREQGVDLYVVAAGSATSVTDFFEQNRLEAAVIHDHDHQIAREYRVSAIPFVLLIDKQGRVAYAHLGWSNDTYETQILPSLETLLAE